MLIQKLFIATVLLGPTALAFVVGISRSANNTYEMASRQTTYNVACTLDGNPFDDAAPVKFALCLQ